MSWQLWRSLFMGAQCGPLAEGFGALARDTWTRALGMFVELDGEAIG